MSRTVARLLLLVVVEAHEYLSAPLSRTGSCLLNGVIMGSKICQTHTTPDTSDDVQCLDDKLTYSHLFHVHPAYENFACGGSTLVKGSRGGSQGLLQECGDLKSDPTHFNMSLPVPGEVATYKAGQEVELGLKGFFHQGVMRVSLCFYEDSACSSPSHFTSYVLGYHFSEGTSGDASAPEGIYSVVLGFKVRMPNRKGRAALQWLVDAEDVSILRLVHHDRDHRCDHRIAPAQPELGSVACSEDGLVCMQRAPSVQLHDDPRAHEPQRWVGARVPARHVALGHQRYLDRDRYCRSVQGAAGSRCFLRTLHQQRLPLELRRQVQWLLPGPQVHKRTCAQGLRRDA